MKKYLLFFALSFLLTSANVFSQATYYWVGGVGPTPWGTAANWNTTLGGGGSVRTTPNAGDILIFDGSNIGTGGSGAVTVNTLVTETVAQLKFINNANVTMGHNSTRTITIAGGTGDDYVIEAGSSVTHGYTGNISAITLILSTGTKASVAGTLTLQLGSHKITPANEAECISFEGTSIFNHNVSSGAAFGNATAVSTNNNVIFKNGSTFNFGGGSNPFVSSAPASVTQFQSGSTYVHNSNNAPSTSGRYYANFILNGTLSSATSWGRIENFTLKTGKTLTITSTGRFSILGNFTIETGATFTTTGATGFPDLLLCGSGATQTVDFGSSTPTFRSVTIGTDAIVNFNSNCTIDPASVVSGNTSNIYGTLNLGTSVITGATTAIFNNRNASTVNTTLTAPLNANSNTVVTGSSSGVSNGMLINISAFPPNTYIIGTSSGTFTLSNYSTSSLPSGTDFTISNNYATVTTSNTGGLNTALPTFSAYALNGKYTFNAATTTPFPSSATSVTPNTLNIAANVTLNKQTDIDSLVNITVGELTTAGLLTLKSTATGTARIAAVAGTLTGDITTETYIPGGRRAYRFLGHPFSTALSMSSLTDDIFVTGDGTTAGTGGATPGTDLDATTSNAASSYWFDQTTNGWKAFMTAADASWTQYAGTRVLVRGDRTQADALTGVAYTPLAVTLDLTGAVNSGNQNIAVSNAGNFHLVSNPYPSPVNIGTVVDATTNIGTMYWVWDANAVSKGAYVPLTVGSGAYNLAMNGAFFVQPTVGTTLAFTEANKTASATANLYRTATASNQLEVQVNYNGGYADKLFVRNNATASTTKEATDGSKLSNPDVNIYAIASTNDQLTLDSRPIAANTVIPVGFTSTIQSNFEIALNSNTLNNGLDVIVKDKFLNVEHTLTASNPYIFAVTADAASQGVNRFELVFRNSNALPTNFVSVSAVQQGNAIAVNFTTANEQNMSSYEVEESANGNSFTKGTSIKANNTATANYNWLDATINNGNNYYRIKAIEKNGVVKYSQVVNVRTGTKGAEFAVYPNPVKGGTVNVQLMNVEQGLYSIKIVNKLGQEIAAKTIAHNGGSATQSINIGNVASGTYNMVISNGTTSVTKTVIVE